MPISKEGEPMPEIDPECRRALGRSIGAVLALGTAAAGILETLEPRTEALQVQAVAYSTARNCLLNTPVTLLCTPETSNTTTTLVIKPPPTVKPAVSTTTPNTTVAPAKPEPISIEAAKGLASATPEEVRYLGCISLKESTNNPKAINRKGPYYGKYQFHQSTWDGFVASIGMEELVGVDIREVPEEVQDFVALEFKRAGRQKEWGPNGKCV